MLPADFVFSQTNLQDYVDCPSRFDLRYLKHINYPAAESEPLEEVEAHMDRGSAFHQLVQQHLIGMEESDIADTIDDDQLAAWWEAYLKQGLRGLPEKRLPEVTLTATIAGRRLVAKYDLLAVQPGGEMVIVDWKTSISRPKRDQLLARLQTIVYRYVLVEAGARLNGGEPVKPEQVRMIYWFANFPDQPEVLAYDRAQHTADAALLTQLISEIETREEFPLTDDVRRCAYCMYRSLHDRGIKAGDFRDAGAIGDAIDAAVSAGDGLADLSLDQIAEIAF